MWVLAAPGPAEVLAMQGDAVLEISELRRADACVIVAIDPIKDFLPNGVDRRSYREDATVV